MKNTDYKDCEIIERLHEEDYPEILIPNVLNRIKNFGSVAADAFEKWMKTGKVDKFEYAGISSDYLKSQFEMKDVALLISLDWLQKQPKDASHLLGKPLM